jgi:hypothetical protein
MKKADLEKHKGKKILGGAGMARGGHGAASDKREQALARKRELLEKSGKLKPSGA